MNLMHIIWDSNEENVTEDNNDEYWQLASTL